ncbi:uncharacterized protein BYT42DRAFT_475894, partial [Radiomyces spectabilis]|uniref:uncharacterized protein n=1 Tax=Radiomyces spectabilis TaxID=64574 RepID=UPI00221FAFCE
IFIYKMDTDYVVDDNCGPEPMDDIVDENEFLLLRPLLLIVEYMKTMSPSECSFTSPMLIEKPKDEGTHMKEADVK